MAQGAQRREGPSDSLVGASQVTPTIKQAPQLQIPNASVPDVVDTTQGRIADALQGWASGRLAEVANKQHEASILDGQMAYQQGVAMDELEMDGDKWAMQGYRVMNAQTTASTMLAAQQQMIQQADYESNPDEFRATYVNRLEQQLEGMDPQTAKLVREQMAEHMPTLVSQQTVAHMQNEEQKTFDALATQVGVLSEDSTAFDAFVANAMGGGAAGGLPQDRVNAALVQGIKSSFNDGNPRAYQLLKASGALANLPAAERNAVNDAKLHFENMQRSQASAEFHAEEAALETAINNNEYSGDFDRLRDDMIAMYAKHGMDVRGNETGAAFALAGQAGNDADRTEALVLQAAIVSENIPAIVEGTSSIIDAHDSGAVIMNNQNAIRDDALSPELLGTLNAVLPGLGLTFEVFSGGQPAANGHNDHERVPGSSPRHDDGDAADGFFVKDGRRLDPQNSPADRVIVSEAISQLSAAGLTGFGSGEDYMQTGSVHLGYGNPAIWGANNRGVNAAGWLVTAVRNPGPGGAGAAWADNVARYNGDVEAAALAHRVDQDTADAWLANGKSWEGIDPAARSYVEGIMTSVNGGDLPTTQAQRLSIAQTNLQSAQSLRDAMLEQETIGAERDLARRMGFAERQLANGSITGSAFERIYDHRRDALDLENTRTSNNYVASQIDNGIKQATMRAEAEGDADLAYRLDQYGGAQAAINEVFKVATATATTPEALQEAVEVFMGSSRAVAAEFGLTGDQTELASQAATVVRTVAAQAKRIQGIQNADRIADVAIENGTAGDVPASGREAVDRRLAARVEDEVRANANPASPADSMTRSEAQIKVWGAAGTVPSAQQQIFSAAINAPLFRDGQPSQGALDAFAVFAALRTNQNFAAAASMFTPKARLRMEHLVDRVPGRIGASPQQVAETMQVVQEEMSTTQQYQDGVSSRGTAGQIDVEAEAAARVHDFLKPEVSSGAFDEWFTPRGWNQGSELSKTQALHALTDEGRAQLENAVHDEYVSLRALNSGVTEDIVMGMAAERVFGRVAVVGNSTIIMNEGYSIAQQMFGDTDYGSEPLVEHKTISQFIAMKVAEDPDKYRELAGLSRGESRVPVVRFFSELFGKEGTLSVEDARDVYRRNNGVRPFELNTNDGINATISVIGTDGNMIELDPDVFSMEAIGAWKMDADIERLSNGQQPYSGTSEAAGISLARRDHQN